MFGNPNSQKRLKRRRRRARTGQAHAERVRGRGRGGWGDASTSRAKFGREGAGTFRCPRPLYIGRNLTYPSRGTFQCRGVGPWKAPRHEPASRARVSSSHGSIFTLLRSFGSENFRELGPSARVRILGLRNHGFFTSPCRMPPRSIFSSCTAGHVCSVDFWRRRRYGLMVNY